jgi:hypothetical protein
VAAAVPAVAPAAWNCPPWCSVGDALSRDGDRIDAPPAMLSSIDWRADPVRGDMRPCCALVSNNLLAKI